jgi:hypothetical protein
MDDLDPTTMIVLAVIAVLLLKPDLLSGLLGGGAGAPAPGPIYSGTAPNYVTLQPPPPSTNSNPTTWPGPDGHAKPPTLPGSVHDSDCPPGQVWNGLAGACMEIHAIGDPDAKWVTLPVAPPPAPEPPQPSPGAPTSVSEVKAAAKRAALFTPFAR